MTRILGLSLLLWCCLALADERNALGQGPPIQNSSDYTINVHVSATHFRECAIVGPYPLCNGGVYVDAEVNGKKVELFGEANRDQARLILVGNHRARLAKKSRVGENEALFQKYDLLLPDMTGWPCEITGLAE